MPSVLLLAFAATLVWLEGRRPLRRRVDPGLRRVARNLAMSAVTVATLQATERPAVRHLTRWVARRGWGIVPALRLPGWLAAGVTLVLFDYTLYVWHILLHRVPLLWRFHLVHHIDLDLDVTTALRFHFGEFLLSVPWRAAQILLVGATPRTLELWQRLTLAEILFHHSNLRLPRRIESRLSRAIVTPRLHGIHHSTVQMQRDSNFSSGLVVWDALHGTLRRDVPQRSITIGVPPYLGEAEVGLGRMLLIPFVTRSRGPAAAVGEPRRARFRGRA